MTESEVSLFLLAVKDVVIDNPDKLLDAISSEYEPTDPWLIDSFLDSTVPYKTSRTLPDEAQDFADSFRIWRTYVLKEYSNREDVTKRDIFRSVELLTLDDISRYALRKGMEDEMKLAYYQWVSELAGCAAELKIPRTIDTPEVIY